MSGWEKVKSLSLGKKIGLVLSGILVASVIGAGASDNPPANPVAVAPEVKSEATTIEPVITTKTITKKRTIPFKSTEQKDSTLDYGSTRVSVRGQKGERTITYELTLTDGVETNREEISSIITKQPVTKVTLIGTKKPVVAQPAPASSCDSNYSGCVPIAYDVDCSGGSGNGPAYVSGPVNVIGYDIYDLDGDDDGVGCE